MNFKNFLSENQISIVLLGLLAGLIFPHVFTVFHAYNTLMLQVIFFLSALRINPREMIEYGKDWKMHLATTAMMLIVLPTVFYFPLSFIAPDWALAFLIALAGPTGMTVALIADFFGGKTSLALIISITTSLLAPFTMPIVFKLLVGRSVPMDAMMMLQQLAEAIIIPFALAWIVQRIIPKYVKKESRILRTASVALFGFLIASIVSRTAGSAGSTASLNISLHVAIALIMAFFALAGMVWVAYKMVYWRTIPERMTIALCMLYMNFTLALWVGDKFFAEYNVVPKLVVILLLLNSLLPFFKLYAAKVVHDKIA